jgi:hypothetical protein
MALLHTVKQSLKLTFEQRLRLIMILFLEFKSRADTVMKGETLYTVVGAPQDILAISRTNKNWNERRGKRLAFAESLKPARVKGKRSELIRYTGCVFTWS